MCVAKCLSRETFNYFTISRNVLFCLFCKKQGYETNETFCDTADLFICFVFCEVVFQKPLIGNRESTAVSLMCYYFAKCSVFRCFSKGCETWKNPAKYIVASLFLFFEKRRLKTLFCPAWLARGKSKRKSEK